MNRLQRRASDRNGKKMQAKPWSTFKDVTDEAIFRHKILNRKIPFRPDKVYQNTKYIVQVFYGVKRKARTYTKVMIRRSDAAPIYSWQDLFRIKNEVFGDEVEAIQFFPPKSELVDDANLYWLWIEEGKS